MNTTGLKASSLNLDADRLETAIFEKIKTIKNLMERDAIARGELQEKFEPALSDITSVKIAKLASEFGAFTIEDGVVIVNEAESAKLMSLLVNDMREAIAEGTEVSPAQVQATLDDAAALYVLHELRHRTQGVGRYSTVTLLKRIEGRGQQAKFDIQADRDAAVALAAATANECEGSIFLEAYQQALFYSVNYFFRIYPANGEKIEQTCRVAALLLMLARLMIVLDGGELERGTPTEALRVSLSEDRASIAVYKNEPTEVLWRAANDQPEVAAFIRKIESGCYMTAVDDAIRLVRQLGIA